jgi:hypothetical protein
MRSPLAQPTAKNVSHRFQVASASNHSLQLQITLLQKQNHSFQTFKRRFDDQNMFLDNGSKKKT